MIILLGTGGGPATEKRLTDLEDRALSVWGREVIDGILLGAVGLGEVAQFTENPVYEIEEVTAKESTDTLESAPKKQSNVRKKSAIPMKHAQEDVIASLQKNDLMVAESINRLAVSIDKLAEGLVEIVKNQNTQIIYLLELIRAQTNN